jgi:hypothetical protein
MSFQNIKIQYKLNLRVISKRMFHIRFFAQNSVQTEFTKKVSYMNSCRLISIISHQVQFCLLFITEESGNYGNIKFKVAEMREKRHLAYFFIEDFSE